MMPSGSVVLASMCVIFSDGRAADATRPIDYTDRNAIFAPDATVKPAARSPIIADEIQRKRVDPPTVDKATVPAGESRTPLEVVEAREKRVQPKVTITPEKTVPEPSALGQKRSGITVATTINPPLVAKYQDSLVAASAANTAHFAALDQRTTAKINRFVFRKNGADPTGSAIGAPVVPAAGGSAVRK
jgi:hypothetical protein